LNKINNLENKEAVKSYRKVAVAACFGTFLEWYDFLTFATLAVVFGPLFFPSSDPNAGLLASLATFGVGMVVRPIGAALFGSMGDRIGRKPVFMITIVLMGLATLCVGFLPTYAQIGIGAPILLVSLRLLQGLSAGGEIGGSAVYLTEHAGNQYRGFKTSFLQLMGPLGILFSTLQIALLRSYLSPEEFLSWGWRVPFWISVLLLLIAFKARMALEETPVFLKLVKEADKPKSQLSNNFRDSKIRKRMFLLFFCVSGSGAILFFCVQVYTIIFLSGLISGTLFVLPAFYLLQKIGANVSDIDNFAVTMMAIIMVGLSAILAMVVGPQTALLAELFPAKARNSAATLPHNLAAGWIGGLLPLIVTWLNLKWASDIAGLWYPTLFLATGAILAVLYLPETRHKKLNH